MKLQAGKFTIDLDSPRVMGIINVTPDSFSDGGQFLSPENALQQAVSMIDAGVDIVDIGGESTRPGANDTSLQVELDRVMPVIESIVNRLDIPLSIDTNKPEVMRTAVDAGAAMINDVFALRREGAVEAVADLGVPVCLMHMLGTPRSMQEAPKYSALPGEVIEFLADRIAACVANGINRDLLLVDPGFGFGKNDRHNLEILAKLDQFAELGLPLLVGLSRKRTLGHLTGKAPDQLVAAGVAAAVIAVQHGADIVRTHNVAETVDALKVASAVSRSGKEI